MPHNTADTANLSREQQTLVIDRILLPFMQRAGITHTMQRTPEQITITIALTDRTTPADPHGERLKRAQKRT